MTDDGKNALFTRYHAKMSDGKLRDIMVLHEVDQTPEQRDQQILDMKFSGGLHVVELL